MKEIIASIIFYGIMAYAALAAIVLPIEYGIRIARWIKKRFRH